MKKLIVLTLAIIMAFSVAACGGANGTDGRDGKDGNNGSNGKSAYEIWLDNGHTGSETDFLNWLKSDTTGLAQRVAQLEGEIESYADKIAGLEEQLKQQQENGEGLLQQINSLEKEMDKRVRDLEDELELKHGIKPDDIDDPMPSLWEHEWEDWWVELNSEEGAGYGLDVKGASEYTIAADVQKIYGLFHDENLKNIYVAADNPVFASEGGVLYSKSFETLYRWPAKKPVTQPRDSIKYFARHCYESCNMPDGFEIPDGTISIGSAAFGFNNLTKLHIKKNVKTVGYDIFITSNARIVKRLEISSPIVYRSFFMSDWIESIVFNEGVRQIRGHAGYNSTIYYLRSVEFPSTLDAIGEVVSFPCREVIKYTIPKNVRYIGDRAFQFYNGYVTQFDCKSDYAQRRIEEIRAYWHDTWNVKPA